LLALAARHSVEVLSQLGSVAIERLSDLRRFYPLRHLTALDTLMHALEQVEVVLVPIRLQIQISGDFA
jgi:hypothetical protein